MNSDNVQNTKKRTKIKDLFVLGGLALVLALATWQVFYPSENKTASVAVSENERKIMQILSQIDGVGNADVMICETEEGVDGVVVVCDGAKNFEVVLNIREAVATALGTEQNSVKIYLKKE